MSGCISPKGQVTIPKNLRDTLGLRPGVKIRIEMVDGRIVVSALRASEADATAGSLRQYARMNGKRTGSSLTARTKRRVADASSREGLHPRHKRAP